jgi:hypothetical protein
MVRDGVDAISGSFKFRGGFIQSPTRAVVSDSTPLRSRALRLLRLRRRARPAFRVFALPGRPEAGRVPATKLITTYTRAGAWAIGYVITYRQFTDYTYRSYIKYFIPAEHPGRPAHRDVRSAPLGQRLRTLRYPRPYRSRSASRVGATARALARERAA